MKTIKFRAWDKEEKDMVFLTSNAFSELLINDCFEKLQARYEIMQYTGLQDKNGKEIYEGDIVKYTLFPEESSPVRIKDTVSFSRGYYILEKRCELLGTKVPYRELEVIGNVWETPELLKK